MKALRVTDRLPLREKVKPKAKVHAKVLLPGILTSLGARRGPHHEKK